ncbi:Imm52 family immunity protein [Aquimarina sp. Aq107]|uniref:Imm52 family immunity protein n=1 Tax=Aquimarina sp. Aq107 TaxID=1191912 RepID=UPI000D55518A|nr:Imm52 family immunity protein [Aquimarina sp. Aq107]
MKIINKISVIWLNRKENLKESTEAFIDFLEELKKFDSRLGNWYLKGNTREEALINKVILEYEFVKKQFFKYADYEETALTKDSFLISFWNGAPKDSLSCTIRASLGGEGKLNSNNCVFNFPYEGEIYEYYRIQENWDNLLKFFIDYWQPDQYRDFEGNLMDI